MSSGPPLQAVIEQIVAYYQPPKHKNNIFQVLGLERREKAFSDMVAFF